MGFIVPATQSLGLIAATGLASFLVAPVLVDGLTQLAQRRESMNPLRLATGIIGGLGFAFGAQILRLLLLGF